MLAGVKNISALLFTTKTHLQYLLCIPLPICAIIFLGKLKHIKTWGQLKYLNSWNEDGM